MFRIDRLTAVVFGVASLAASAVMAEFPDRPITVYNGAGVGGGVDTYGRVVASVAPEVFDGQPMVVVNKPGGAHTVALKNLARAEPDGYTLAMVSFGSSVTASTLRDLDLDPIGGFEFVAQVGAITPALIVRRDSPYETPQDVVAAARSEPGGLVYGHSGRGSSTNISMVAWLNANGLTMKDVPFKGGGHSRAALIAGDIDVLSTGIQQYSGFEDKLRALGVFPGTRDGAFGDVPTMKEQGVAFVDVYSPVMIMAPKGTPPDVVARLEQGIAGALENKAFKKLAAAAKLNVVFAGSAQSRTLMENLRQEWSPALAAVKATMN